MKGNEPAFPGQRSAGWDVREGKEWHDGMTLRDYFAAKAMAALISAAPNAPHTGPFDDEPISHYRRRVAYGSYQWADAMLDAREVPNG